MTNIIEHILHPFTVGIFNTGDILVLLQEFSKMAFT